MAQLQTPRRGSSQRLAENTRLVAAAAGTRFWLPAVVVLIVAVIAIPVMWVLLAHWGGIPLGSSGSLGALLATIGGIMGAIFTVGGLIIALVSVYTQLAIEDRIRRSFEALQPELDERARSQIEAYLAFSRAAEQRNWRTADSLAREALEKWPSLQGVRSALGERMSKDVTTWFVRNKLEPRYSRAPQFSASPGIFWNYQADSFSLDNLAPIVNEAEEDMPTMEAIHWLKDAIGHGEDVDGTLCARVACMYGVCSRYDDMIDYVQKALAADGQSKTFLTYSTNLAMLAYACRNSANMIGRLGQLGQLLGVKLPASAEDVLQSLEDFKGPWQQTPWIVAWIAIKKVGHRSPPTAQLALSAIQVTVDDATGTRSGWASWRGGSTDQVVVPGPGPSYIPIADLVQRLGDEFVFVCPR